MLPIFIAVSTIRRRVDSFTGEESCMNEILPAVYDAADIDELTIGTVIHLNQLTNFWMNLYGPSAPCRPCIYHDELISSFGVYSQIS